MKKLKVVLLYDSDSPFPNEEEYHDALKGSDWNSEVSVAIALKKLKHDVRPLGFYSDINIVIKEIREYKPDVVFNLAEASLGEYFYDRNIPALLELLRVPYTGCSPADLMICNNKALSKKALSFHKLKVPGFHVCPKNKKIRVPSRLKPPFFIKPLREEASMGISQTSLTDNEKDCKERVKFIHEHFKKHAIIEEYIDGRELYVGVMGNKRPKVFPVWEMKFTQVPEDEPKIATYKAKWDNAYRKKWGIKNGPSDPFANGVYNKIQEICKKAYKVLNIEGHVRFDLRLTPENNIYIIEANANPELARDADFAESVEKSGMKYEEMIKKILNHALNREQ